MTLNEYQKLAARTMNRELDGHQLLEHSLFGMCGELGEIQSIFQKQFQGHEVKDDELRKETGDLLWFIAEFATMNGWNLSEIANENIVKLMKRYPEGFEKERSVNRKKYETD